MSKIAVVEGTQSRTLEALAADLVSAPDLKTAVANTTVPALLHDRSRVLHVNAGLLRWLGYQHKDDLLGAPLSELSETEDSTSLHAALGARPSEPPARSHIQRFVSESAETLIANVLSRQAILDGNVVVLSLCEPTSSTQRSPTLLRLLEEAVDHMHDIVFITEAESIDGVGRRIVFVNRIFSLITGYAPSDVLGKTPNITIGDDTDPETLRRIERNLRAREPVHEELLKYKKYGDEYWVELDILPVFDESGQHTHWVSVQRDISERRRLETRLVESERLASSGLLAAKVANEINQPLAAAQSSLRLLSERLPELLTDVDNKEVPSILEAVRDARAATARVTSSATYLRLLAATGRATFGPTNVNDVLERAIHWLDTSLSKPPPIEKSYGELPLVLADADRLVHLFHLVLQAAASLPRAHGRTLEVRSFSHHGHVQISIRHHEDTHGEARSERPEQRRGLGLFVAEYLVRELGGHLEMSSADAIDVLLPL